MSRINCWRINSGSSALSMSPPKIERNSLFRRFYIFRFSPPYVSVGALRLPDGSQLQPPVPARAPLLVAVEIESGRKAHRARRFERYAKFEARVHSRARKTCFCLTD